MLLSKSNLPWNETTLNAYNQLKTELKESCLAPFDENKHVVVETDASNISVAGVLTQEGRPVAFYSRTLHKYEKHYPSIEKEALSIVESVRHWRHFLCRPFTILTDQQAVSYIFNSNIRGKTKNDKLLRWRLDLSPYNYEISYRPGVKNIPADALSRVCAVRNATCVPLVELHKKLCHPGVQRLFHYVSSRNLPYSLNDVRQICSQCDICCRIKPMYCRQPNNHVVKATKPFERLSVDFVGPKPSKTRNKYLLVICDEYSRFIFAYPCSEITSRIVIEKLKNLFSLFGTPSLLHSDRGTQFLSKELHAYLFSQGIHQSRTTPNNPKGNGQCERAHQTLWRAIELALASNNMPIDKWEMVLDDALNAQRSLLCTSTNSTPHDRMFFHGRTPTVNTIPTWLLNEKYVNVRKHLRNKNDPKVEKVELLTAGPQYSYIRYPNGRVDTVSNRDIAPVNNRLRQSTSQI